MYCYFAVISALFWTTPTVFSNATLTRNLKRNDVTCAALIGHNSNAAPGCGSINCGIRHVTVPIATRILIANVRHIGLSNICVINLVYFKMQV